MLVEIRGEKVDMQVTSIILTKDPTDPNDEKINMLHCYFCGSNVVKYQGRVIWILPGNAKVSLPVIAQCPKCKRQFSIQDIV